MNTNSLSNFLFHGNEHDSIKYHLHLKVLTVNTNSLSSSLSCAGGISSTFLSSILSFEERVLAGLRLCRLLLQVFDFLFIYEVIYCCWKESKCRHFFFHFVFTEKRAGVALHHEVLSFVFLIGRTMYFHSRSLFWLVGCVFRSNFTRAFFRV